MLVAQFWSAAQVKAYRLADNQLAAAATWDDELLRIELAEIIDMAEVSVEVLGWSTGEIDVILDFSVCTTWGYRDCRWHLADVHRERLSFPDLKRAVLRQKRLWRADEVIIEHARSGISLWQEFRAAGDFRPMMWRVTQDKETRLIGVTSQLEAGLCVLPADAPWLDAFRHELRSFPFGRNDDQVDSMTQFLEYHLRWSRELLEERDPVTGRKLRINRPNRIARR